MYTLYVLESEVDAKWYIGQTSNLAARILEHNRGRVKSTKVRKPFKLIYKIEFPDRSSALKAEKYYKSGAGRIKLKRFINNNYKLI